MPGRPPEPRPGLVIHYEYLWRHEHLSGRDDGSKRRPAVIVVAVASGPEGKTRVLVAPVTHREPEPPAEGVRMPPKVKRHLGLDDEPSWIITTDVNVFEWPGVDLYPVPGGGSYAYGEIPPSLLMQVKAGIQAARRRGLAPVTARSAPPIR